MDTGEPTRALAYAELKTRVGVRPSQVADAPPAVLGAIARRGGAIAVALRARRLREVATTVRDAGRGGLRKVLRLPYVEARRALMAFPSIEPPGADRILPLTGNIRSTRSTSRGA